MSLHHAEADAVVLLGRTQHRTLCMLSALLGGTFEGVTVAARSAKNKGLISPALARRCERLDGAAHFARHATAEKMHSFLLSFAEATGACIPEGPPHADPPTAGRAQKHPEDLDAPPPANPRHAKDNDARKAAHRCHKRLDSLEAALADLRGSLSAVRAEIVDEAVAKSATHTPNEKAVHAALEECAAKSVDAALTRCLGAMQPVLVELQTSMTRTIDDVCAAVAVLRAEREDHTCAPSTAAPSCLHKW